MPSILVTLGDSWPQGAELLSGENPFGFWLQKELDMSHWTNLGQGGASNEHLVIQLKQFLVTNFIAPVTAVFFITNPARSIYWKGDMFCPTNNIELKQQFLHFHNHDTLRTAIIVAALQKICAVNKINDYYLPGWQMITDWLPGTDLDKIYGAGKLTAADMLQANKHNGEHLVDVDNNYYIKPNLNHPNERGHKIIAAKLAEWIKYQQGDH